MRRSAMRRVLLLTVLALLLAAGYQPLAFADPAPALDAVAAEQAISTQPIYRAPGAVAQLDEPRVRAELTPDTRVVLAPWVDYEHTEADRTTISALGTWAREQQLKVIVVTGLSVRLLPYGAFEPSGLAGLQTQLAYSDVTDLVVLAARNVRDGTEHLDDRQPVQGPADAAEVAALTAQLRTNPRYVAPGAGTTIPPDGLADSRTPGLPFRVALLPALPLGAPFPDVAGPIAEAFPGELVIVVRGRWIDASGPGQNEVNAARNYTFGRYAKPFTLWGTAPYLLVRSMLDRLAQLRDGAAFHRPMIKPVLADELFDRYAQSVFITLAVLLGGGSVAWWAYRERNRRHAAASALRLERAGAYAQLTAVGSSLLAADAANPVTADDTRLLGDAAERHATARILLEQADDAGAVQAARAVAAEAQRLLAKARGVHP